MGSSPTKNIAGFGLAVINGKLDKILSITKLKIYKYNLLVH